MNLNKLIEKYKENITECERVIKAYQHTEKTKFIHHGMIQASKEFIQDLEELKEPTVCGYTVEEVSNE